MDNIIDPTSVREAGLFATPLRNGIIPRGARAGKPAFLSDHLTESLRERFEPLTRGGAVARHA